jgi:hypothetical protein
VRRKKKLRRGLSSSTSVFLVVVLAIGALYLVPKLQGDSTENGQKNEQLPSRPPKSTEEAKAPLGIPAAVPSEGGKFEVIATQTDNTDLPVAWDPCRPIHYVVNTANAPDDGASMIRSAIKQVSVASGLQFVYDGTTREQLSKNREAYLPTRYGADRWAPVLIGWSNETVYPDLAGYIAGEAGPTWVNTPDGAHLVSVSGQVALDADDLSLAKVPNRAEALAVILHEFGHLVGLAHTNDSTQLMYSENKFNTLTYQAGDLNGLSELGTQPCYPDV